MRLVCEPPAAAQSLFASCLSCTLKRADSLTELIIRTWSEDWNMWLPEVHPDDARKPAAQCFYLTLVFLLSVEKRRIALTQSDSASSVQLHTSELWSGLRPGLALVWSFWTFWQIKNIYITLKIWVLTLIFIFAALDIFVYFIAHSLIIVNKQKHVRMLGLKNPADHVKISETQESLGFMS